MADDYYQKFMRTVESFGVHVEAGEFGAEMKVSLLNDGPVTIMVEA